MDSMNASVSGKRYPVLMKMIRMSGTTRVARLREDIDPARVIEGDHSDDWKRVDVAVLQEMVLRPFFGISADDHASLERLSFAKDAHEALKLGDADAADPEYRLAIDSLQRQTGWPTDLAKAYRRYGKFLRRRGQLAAAMEMLELASDTSV
jgi:hypothetical protein